jgi:hypothetical protein
MRFEIETPNAPEPYADKPPVRFGGRDGINAPFLPLSKIVVACDEMVG